jgi:hypothetical protein
MERIWDGAHVRVSVENRGPKLISKLLYNRVIESDYLLIQHENLRTSLELGQIVGRNLKVKTPRDCQLFLISSFIEVVC